MSKVKIVQYNETHLRFKQKALQTESHYMISANAGFYHDFLLTCAVEVDLIFAVFLDKGNKSGLGEQSLSLAAQKQSRHAALKLQPVYKLKQTPARHAKQAKASVETRAAIFS
jgi:hypothetical protein